MYGEVALSFSQNFLLFDWRQSELSQKPTDGFERNAKQQLHGHSHGPFSVVRFTLSETDQIAKVAIFEDMCRLADCRSRIFMPLRVCSPKLLSQGSGTRQICREVHQGRPEAIAAFASCTNDSLWDKNRRQFRNELRFRNYDSDTGILRFRNYPIQKLRTRCVPSFRIRGLPSFRICHSSFRFRRWPWDNMPSVICQRAIQTELSFRQLNKDHAIVINFCSWIQAVCVERCLSLHLQTGFRRTYTENHSNNS